MVPKSTLNNAQLEDSSFVGAHLTGARRTYTNRTIANLTGATAAITGFPGGRVRGAAQGDHTSCHRRH